MKTELKSSIIHLMYAFNIMQKVERMGLRFHFFIRNFKLKSLFGNHFLIKLKSFTCSFVQFFSSSVSSSSSSSFVLSKSKQLHDSTNCFSSSLPNFPPSICSKQRNSNPHWQLFNCRHLFPSPMAFSFKPFRVWIPKPR